MFSNSLRCHPFLVLIHHGKLGIGHLRVPGRQIRDILGLHFFFGTIRQLQVHIPGTSIGHPGLPCQHRTVMQLDFHREILHFTCHFYGTRHQLARLQTGQGHQTQDQRPTYILFHTLLVLNFYLFPASGINNLPKASSNESHSYGNLCAGLSPN
jgi:hypothetical protein